MLPKAHPLDAARDDRCWTALEPSRAADSEPRRKANMDTNKLAVGVVIVVMITVVISVDLLFFKDRFWERLIANIGIVMVFTAFYLRFLKNP